MVHGEWFLSMGVASSLSAFHLSVSNYQQFISSSLINKKILKEKEIFGEIVPRYTVHI